MKKSIVLLLTLILAISILQFGVSASENIYVTVDGATLNFDQPPIMQNDRVLVPMRLIFETLGATVEWDEYNQYVKATKDDISITMQIGNNTMVKNGQYITLDTAPILLNGRTLVPVRAVAESLEATVEWRGDINTVVIEQKVIPKRYATETVVYAPDAKSIITDKDNNIYYIQDNKVMIYKNGIASVYADVEEDSNYYSDYYDEWFWAYSGVDIESIVYDESRNVVLGIMNGTNDVGLVVDLSNHNVLAQGFNCRVIGDIITILDENYLYISASPSETYKINLQNGQYSTIDTDGFESYGGNTRTLPSLSTAIVNSKLTFMQCIDHNVYFYQYNPSKDSLDMSKIMTYNNSNFENLYIGTDGINFYYTKDYNIYQVTPTKQINQWLNYEEIDFQDQTAIIGSGRFTFDQDDNILFYDENVESIRRIKKLK